MTNIPVEYDTQLFIMNYFCYGVCLLLLNEKVFGEYAGTKNTFCNFICKVLLRVGQTLGWGFILFSLIMWAL